MKYIKIRKIQISGLPPQRRITRKLHESSFGPCSQFWHPNLSTVHQDAKIADMHHRSRNRAVSRMIILQVLICINFHTAMHSDRFLAAEIEIAKSARCQTTRARTSCSRYRRKLYHIYIYIYLKVSDIRSVSRDGTSSLRSSVIKYGRERMSTKQYLRVILGPFSSEKTDHNPWRKPIINHKGRNRPSMLFLVFLPYVN